jgi:type II secretory pathway predicted ATPase ExeA
MIILFGVAFALAGKLTAATPRAVNNLALQALIAAFATNKTIVDETSTRTAITE